MRLLVAAPCLPCPPDYGGRIRMYNLYGPLAKKHEVWWLSPRDPAAEDYLRQTERMFARVVAVSVPTRPPEAPGYQALRTKLEYVARIARKAPFPIEEELRRALASLLEDNFDAVLVENETMAVYIRRAVKNVPWILSTQNIPSVVERRVWQHTRHPGRRFSAWLSYRSMLKFETDTFPMFDVIVVASEVERRTLSRRFPETRTYCVPNGVSSALAQVQTASAPSGKVLNFTGFFKYWPNEDAVRYFCSAIFPEILRRDGNVTLRLVGKGSDALARSLSPRLPVLGLGYVQNPLDALSTCAAVVAPFRIGGGTRIKILEAIALGIPVIATKTGAEGIELDASCGLLVADSPLDFAQKVLLALSDPRVRDSARNTGRTRVLSDYSWESASARMAEAVASLATSDRRKARAVVQ